MNLHVFASVYTIDESNGDMWFCERRDMKDDVLGLEYSQLEFLKALAIQQEMTLHLRCRARLNLDVTERKNHAPLTTFKKSSNWFQRHYLYGSDGNSLGTNFSTNGLTIPENTLLH